MKKKQDFKVVEGSLLISRSSAYEVEKLLGSGTFGDVAQCRKLATKERIAVKFFRDPEYIWQAKEERTMLKRLKDLGADKFHIIQWNFSFTFETCFCLAFELLDISLPQFLQSCQNHCLELKEIRPIIQQLATALVFLQSAGIVHADLKPENIMMVDHVRQPLKVKVIDFGLAYDNHEDLRGQVLQSMWYRCPEVLLGVPFNEAIDVWSLGCIAAEMLTGVPLLQGKNEYDMVRHIIHTIGFPPTHLLWTGWYTKRYFHYTVNGRWIFLTPTEVGMLTWDPCRFTNLTNLLRISPKSSKEDAWADTDDQLIFVGLLFKMLQVDAAVRIKPEQILQHPFVTMSHFEDMLDCSLHVKSCAELMSSVQLQSSDLLHAVQTATGGQRNQPKSRLQEGKDDSVPFIPSEGCLGATRQQQLEEEKQKSRRRAGRGGGGGDLLRQEEEVMEVMGPTRKCPRFLFCIF